MNSFESMLSVRYLIASILCATCCSMPHLVNLITGAEQRPRNSTTQSSNNGNRGANSNNEHTHRSFSSPSTSKETHPQSKQYSETIYHHYAKIGQLLDRKPQQLKIGALTDTLSVNQQINNGTLTNKNLSSIPFSSSSNMSVNKTVANVLGSMSVNNSNVTQVKEDLPVVSMLPPEDIPVHKDLPLPLLIASPVAAVSIIIFVCIAYYCHSSQLDARARQLALKYAVISTEPPACHRGVPSTSSVDIDLIRKPSLRPSTSRTSTPNQTPDGSKRGSINWVAIGDQEVITYTAARRHSTFIL